ncbi:Protein of unknown function (DUF1523) [Thioflavicoccus mobilis 8321]|uniref:Uncharacterized protein n=1 Tax=Thioflavicoccus mobilis 8321 TaxID=765912 RepID=L0GXG6_9GAMM|nr:DUF1523 family protein [Thioflavicoccus mobilis]AGA90512.1 Protein of unknown function (DUF1523) [Thioflavicoccus mobilis 8321]
MKQKIITALAVIAVIALAILWLRFGPDSWEVQVTGVTGDGQRIQYRIETVHAGSSKPLIFRNEDAGFLPPYFKFDSADLQSNASRISRNCPDVPVKVHGYSLRIPWLSMFPNATSIDAPQRCLVAPSSEE